MPYSPFGYYGFVSKFSSGVAMKRKKQNINYANDFLRDAGKQPKKSGNILVRFLKSQVDLLNYHGRRYGGH